MMYTRTLICISLIWRNVALQQADPKQSTALPPNNNTSWYLIGGKRDGEVEVVDCARQLLHPVVVGTGVVHPRPPVHWVIVAFLQATRDI